MISKRERGGGGGEKKKKKREEERKRPQEETWWTERVERKHYYRLPPSLSLSLLSLERRDPTRPGLNWAGHVDGEQGRDRGILYVLGRDGLGTGQRVPR